MDVRSYVSPGKSERIIVTIRMVDGYQHTFIHEGSEKVLVHKLATLALVDAGLQESFHKNDPDDFEFVEWDVNKRSLCVKVRPN